MVVYSLRLGFSQGLKQKFKVWKRLTILLFLLFQIKCGSCGTVSDKETSVVASELIDIPKSKGSANLVQRVRHSFNFKVKFTISNALFSVTTYIIPVYCI